MANHIRYGDLERAMGGGERQISLDALSPTLKRDAEGNLVPVRYEKIRLPFNEILKILKPYFSVRFMEQVKAVVPLAAYLALFQILFLQHLVEDSWIVTGGLFAVIVGLMLFMEGLALGLMPFGTVIGWFATLDMSLSVYQLTMHRTSPPWPAARAWRSLITPWDVDTMATPRPFWMLGMSSLPLYRRRPGRLARCSFSITGMPS